MALGDNIRRRRIELKMTQQELADSVGYKTRSSIAKIEKNNTGVSQDQLLIMARVLHTTVNYLITGTVSENEIPHGEVIPGDELQNTFRLQSKKKKCTAVILAGGSHRVNRLGIPLQFVSVKNKPVIIYTMEAYQHHPMIDEIYVVCLGGWEEFIQDYADKFSINKLKDIIPAGESGIRSVKNAVEWLASSCSPFDLILIHEATRPLVDPEVISNAILCCNQYGSGITFERMDRMTPFLENEQGTGLTHLSAEKLINVQSPEAYSLGSLRQAFHTATEIHHPLDETICAVFLHSLGKNLKFCEGNHNNLRIVNEDDLRLLEALIS